MNPAEMAQALLDAPDAAARQALLVPHDAEFYIQVVGRLKDEVDRERLRDPGAALRLADVAAEVAGFAAAPHAQALAAWARGNALIHLGDYEEALRLYRQAAHFFAAQGAELEAARLTANQAFVLKNLGRYAEGLEAAQAALFVLRRYPPSAFLASVLTALGALYRLLRRYDEALAAYDEAGQIQADLGDEVKQARLAINRANVLENLDRFAEALALLHQARAILVEHGRSLEVARADLNLGILYSRLGRYDQALEALQRAEEGFAALGNTVEVAVVALYRADLYAEFNLYEDLLHSAACDWRLFEDRQMQWHAARATLHRAVAWRRLGDTAQAEELLVGVQAAFARLDDPLWAWLAGLERAALWAEMGEWDQALPLAVETAAFLRDRGMPLRAAASSLLAAHCQLALGRPAEAAERYREVLDLAQTLAVPSLLYRAHYGLGRVAEAQGRLPEALHHLRQAVEGIEGLRQRLRVEDLRLSFVEDKLQVYRDAVLLCLRLGYADEAFAYVERAKSGALADLLVSNLGRGTPPAGSPERELTAHLAALRERLNWHYNQLEGGEAEERGQAWQPSETEVWQRIAATEREIVRAWRELQQTAPFYALLNPDLSTSAAGQSCLYPNEVLLHYYLSGDTLHVFVLGPDGLRACQPLGCTVAQIKEALSALDTTLQSASSFAGDYVAGILDPLSRQQLGWLYDDLLRPLAPFVEGAERLLIAPDGCLFEVPFHALHDGAGYLLERYEVACVPSAGVLRLCRENLRAAVPGPALVVGYAREERLPYIRQEVETVARTLSGATVLVDEAATLAGLWEHAGRSALLHLAAHAVFRCDNPLFSALQLAGGEWLRVLDLYTLPLNGALVTLSGCETGRHRLLGGDLAGLSRGFFGAGASALVVSLWPVADAATALLMDRFYTGLAAGETAAAALRRAQLAVRTWEQERDGLRLRPYAHPFYWAPFCLLGAPEVRVAR